MTRWLFVTLGASIFSVLDGGWLASWLSFVPSKIFHGQVWRLVTWPLIEASPLQIVLTCLAIYKFGGELAVRWGDRRLRRFVLQIAIVAAAITLVLAALTGAMYMRRVGGWAVINVLVITWARQFPNAPLVLHGMVALSGQQLINVTIGTTILFALFTGPIWMALDLVACFAAALYPRGWLRR
ncbi:MAG TPA: rhomboid family intramembrane serine protease [Kofleriaceae bacterium]